MRTSISRVIDVGARLLRTKQFEPTNRGGPSPNQGGGDWRDIAGMFGMSATARSDAPIVMSVGDFNRIPNRMTHGPPVQQRHGGPFSRTRPIIGGVYGWISTQAVSEVRGCLPPAEKMGEENRPTREGVTISHRAAIQGSPPRPRPCPRVETVPRLSPSACISVMPVSAPRSR